MTDGNSRTNRWRESTWHAALDVAGLPPDLDRLALVIARQGRADGTRARASNRWLAARLGWSESTVKRRLTELARAGWIERTETGRRRGDDKVTANVYRLLVPVSTGQPTRDPDPLRPHLNGSAEGSQQVTATASTGQSPVRRDPPPREDPPSSSRAAAPRNTPLPADFVPSTSNRDLATRIGADLERELAALREKAGLLAWERSDWQAALRRWLLNVEQHGPSEPPQPARPNVHTDTAYDPEWERSLPPPPTEPVAWLYGG